MRYHFTKHFSECRNAYDAALGHYRIFDDESEGAFERERQADATLDSADRVFFNCDAYTPHEIHLKIIHALERGRGLGGIEDYYRIPAINADFERLKRMAPSSPIDDAFQAFREFEIEWNCDPEALDASEEALDRADQRISLYLAILDLPCTTPGDFILKQWLRLRSESGYTDTPSLQAEGTANLWDIQRDDDDGDGRLNIAERHSTYDDIDATDLGAHLLAYGKTDFDAGEWMEVAVRIGMHVSLILHGYKGKGQIGFGMDLKHNDHSPRMRREQDRLLRIMAFDPDGKRLEQLHHEIKNNWPHLISQLPETAELAA